MRRVVDDHELGDTSVSLITVQLRCVFVFFSFSFLILDQICCKLICLSRLKNGTNTSYQIVLFSGELGQGTGHHVHGHLLRLPVRSVQLGRVFQTGLFGRIQRLLQYIKLEYLRSEQRHERKERVCGCQNFG